MGVPDSIRLVKSPNLIAIPVGRGYLVYNSLEGGPVVLNEEGYSVLALFGVARSLKEVRKDFTITGLGRWVKKMVDWKFLIQEGADERVYFHRKTERAIKRIARGQHLISLGLVLDEACNFNCSYCVSKKLIVASGRSASGMSRMTWEVAQKSLDSFLHTRGTVDTKNLKSISVAVSHCSIGQCYKRPLSIATRNTTPSLDSGFP